MKKAGVLLLLLLFLSGCSGKSEEIDRGMQLRAQLLRAQSCTFDAEITADYGDKVFTFLLACQADSTGDLTFTVSAPESISGITGTVTDETGSLVFDDTVLQFEKMADGQVTPVTAPWLFLKTLRSGYLTAAGMDGDALRLTIDDSYEDDALQMDIWLDDKNSPLRGEVLYDGRRILTLNVTNFQIL